MPQVSDRRVLVMRDIVLHTGKKILKGSILAVVPSQLRSNIVLSEEVVPSDSAWVRRQHFVVRRSNVDRIHDLAPINCMTA